MWLNKIGYPRPPLLALLDKQDCAQEAPRCHSRLTFDFEQLEKLTIFHRSLQVLAPKISWNLWAPQHVFVKPQA